MDRAADENPVPKGAGATHLDEAACAAALPDDPCLAFDGDRAAELEAVGQLLEAAPWTFAKTMPEIRTNGRCGSRADSEAFTRCVQRIRQLGTKRRWRTMTNIKLDVGERDYWGVEADRCPASLVTLINRAIRADDE